MRIIHVGSLFIGLQNVGKSEDTIYQFSQIHDYFEYLSFIVDYILANSIDIVLFSGNLFFSSTPNSFFRWKLNDLLKRIIENNTDVFILRNQYDRFHNISLNEDEAINIGLDKSISWVNKPFSQVIKRKSDSVQLAFLPYTNNYPKKSANRINNMRQTEFENKLKILSSQINAESPSILLTYSAIDKIDPFYLFDSVPKIPSTLIKNLPFNYFALSNYPFPKIDSLDKENNKIIHYAYPGSLGEIEFDDSLIERGFILYDTKTCKPPVFIQNQSLRPSSFIRIQCQNEEEVYEKLNEEFLLNDYRDFITNIVIQIPVTIDTNFIREKYADHCFHIQKITTQKKLSSCRDTIDELSFSHFLRSYLSLENIQEKDLSEDVYNRCIQYFEKVIKT